MNFTKRQIDILQASLSYAYSNVNDINDAMSDLHLPVIPLTEDEIEDMQKMLGFDYPAPTQDEADAIVQDILIADADAELGMV